MNKSRYLLLLIIVFSGCTGGNSSFLFSLTPAGQLEMVTPNSLSETVANFSASQSDITSAPTEIIDTSTKANSLTNPDENTFTFPSVTLKNSQPMLHFLSDGSTSLTSSGLAPYHLSDEFSFIFTATLTQSGTLFVYGTDEDHELIQVSYQAPNLILKHQSSDSNYYSRSYDLSSVSGSTVVFGVTAGNTAKDIELYINGFRKSEFTASSSGTAEAYSTVLRHLYIGGAQSADFYLGQMIVLSGKIGPKSIYQVSKYLGAKWGSTISTTLTKEIRTNQAPEVEPDVLNYAFIATVILDKKCAVCHKAGDTPPYLDSYANIMSAVSQSQPVISAGDSNGSLLYQSVLSGSMPKFSSPLSNTNIEYLRRWIDEGAIE